MSPEKQRIAIAGACGWKPDESHHGVTGEWDTVQWFALRPHPGGGAYTCDVRVPDYTRDLNAMHEAEKVLTCRQRGEMTLWIQHMACAGYGPQLFATAAQRAEAFLRTIGKWEEQ